MTCYSPKPPYDVQNVRSWSDLSAQCCRIGRSSEETGPRLVCCTLSVGLVSADEKERVLSQPLRDSSSRGRLSADGQAVKQTISLEPRWAAGHGIEVAV